MKIWTYANLRDKILRDQDLQDETFITAPELITYVNEGISEAVAEIHKIHEDYFLKTDSFALVSGTSDYALPTDIYANKIRQLVYDNGSTWIYQIERIRPRGDASVFVGMAASNIYPTSVNILSYKLVNASAAAGTVIRFFPTPQLSGNLIKRWYLREANLVPQVGDANPSGGFYSQADVDSTLIDIPEFYTFVIQFAKVRCLEKEQHPDLEFGVKILENHRKMMVDTLTGMSPDDNDEVFPDLSFYRETS